MQVCVITLKNIEYGTELKNIYKRNVIVVFFVSTATKKLSRTVEM